MELIQERWFLNFTFHKGTCIVRGTLFSVKLLQRDFPLPWNSLFSKSVLRSHWIPWLMSLDEKPKFWLHKCCRNLCFLCGNVTANVTNVSIERHISVAVDTAEPDHLSTCFWWRRGQDLLSLWENGKTQNFRENRDYPLSWRLFIILTSILTIPNR